MHTCSAFGAILCLAATSAAAAQGSWEFATPLPVGKVNNFAVKWNGDIYTVGGAPWVNGGDMDGSVYRLDAGGWTQVASLQGMGPMVDQVGGVDAMNRIVVFGGHDAFSEDYGSTRLYLPTEGVIENVADSDGYSYNYVATAVDGQNRVYRIGGGYGPYFLNYGSVARFIAASRTWEPVAYLPYSRSSVSSAYDGQGHIWCFGGYTSFGMPRIVDTIRYDIESNTWTSEGSVYLPVATSNGQAVLGADGKIYVIGGMTGGSPSGTTTSAVWVLDPNAGTLTAGPSLNLSRCDFGAVLGDDKWIYVIGGVSTAGDASRSVERLYTGLCSSISEQSGATTLPAGATLSLSAVPEGDAPLTVHWTHDGMYLDDGPTGHGSTVVGAETPQLTIHAMTQADAGDYALEVTNPCGAVLGEPITVTVEGAMFGDIDGNGHVNGADLGLLLAAWGIGGLPGADLNSDGVVNDADLGMLLSAWAP